jgi:hypothetical protein
MYVFLDAFFLCFHTALVLFNVLGWAWEKTRRANLAALLLTAGSWVLLGIWKGFGYCPCTDWHWQVRRRLGRGEDLPNSYMKFLADAVLGADVPAALADAVTVIGLVIALAVSLYVNVRDGCRSAR